LPNRGALQRCSGSAEHSDPNPCNIRTYRIYPKAALLRQIGPPKEKLDAGSSRKTDLEEAGNTSISRRDGEGPVVLLASVLDSAHGRETCEVHAQFAVAEEGR
jgi:hypothetical protein